MTESDQSQLDELFQQWKEANAAGRPVALESLCRNCPHLLPHLERRVREMDTIPPGSDDVPHFEANGNSLQAADRGPPTEPLATTADFRNLRFHAEGGLGEVYVARDTGIGREVAVKLIKSIYAADADHLNRFFRESEVTGRLEHPGVVPVYAIGHTAEGRPFYVMRFVNGQTFSEAIEAYHRPRIEPGDVEQRGVEFRKLLAHFVSVCNTVAYAHNRGVVHLDLKPDNIMLGRYGETLVLDWGLATVVGRDDRARASGEATLRPRAGGDSSDSSGKGAGTPSYMSPEQTPEGSGQLSPLSDVYSLGATLYKLLTSHAAFRGRDIPTVMARVRRGDFPRPRQVRRDVPTALENVCLKAMSLDPARRYATPLDLAADIERWLADEPVSVGFEPPLERVARWTRRHRTVTHALLATAAVLLVAAWIVAGMFGQMAEHQRQLRFSAEVAREQGLVMAARFAARTVASEIDLRWRVLEAAAAESELRAALASLSAESDPATRDALQRWLDRRYKESLAATKASSWFVTDARGVQLARAPFSRDTANRNFAYRDYFHGQGRDLDAETDAPIRPIGDVHRSCVYQSHADGTLRVAFSVPVWSGSSDSPSRHVLGVLAMSVELGQFSVLQTGLGVDQTAVLVDTQQDWIEDEPRAGLVLHHPHLAALAAARPANGASEVEPTPLRLSGELVARLRQLRSARLAAQRSEESGNRVRPTPAEAELAIERHYSDPAGGLFAGQWLAAFEPVLVRGRRDSIQDTGWVVIVQERSPLR